MPNNFYKKLEQTGHTSVFDVVALGRERFLAKTVNLYSDSTAEQLYEKALSRASMVTRRYLEALGQPPEKASLLVKALVEQPTWDEIFPEDSSALCSPDSLEANHSPAAYLNQLYRLALTLEGSQTKADYLLKIRRPDLPELSIDGESWKAELPTQQLVNEIIERGLTGISSQEELSVSEKLSQARYPMQLPYDAPTDSIQRSLAVHNSNMGRLLLQSADEPAFLLKGNNNSELRNVQRGTLNIAPELKHLCGEKPVFYAGTLTPETQQNNSLIGPDITSLLPWQIKNDDVYRCGFVTAAPVEAKPPASELSLSTTVNVNTILSVPCYRVSGDGPQVLFVEVGACSIQPAGTGSDAAPKDVQTYINNAVTGKRKPSQRHLKLWFNRIKHHENVDQNYDLQPNDVYTGTLRLQAKSYGDQGIIGEFAYSIQFQGNTGDITTPDAKDYCVTHYGRPLLESTRTGVEVRLQLDDILTSCKLSRAELETLLCQHDQAPRISPNCQPTNQMYVQGRSAHSFPAPYHYGAVYLHGGAAPLLRIEDPIPEKGGSEQPQLCGSATVIERLHRFIRMQHALNLGHEELDRLILACSVADRNNSGYSMTLSDNTFRALGLFQQWRQHYNVDAQTFAAILYQINPFSLGSAVPQLDHLFNRDCLEKDSLTLDWLPQDDDFSAGDLHPWSKRLCAGLHIDENTYRVLAPLVLQYQPLPEANTQPKRLYHTLDMLSAFHRIVSVFRLLGYSPLDGIALVNLLEDPESVWQQLAGQPTFADTNSTSDILDNLVRLEALATWLHSQTLQPSAVYLLLKREGMTVTPTDTLTQWLNGIAEQVEAVLVNESCLQSLGLPEKDDTSKEIDWPLALTTLVDSNGLLQSTIENEDHLPDLLSSALANLKLKDKANIHQKLLNLLSPSLAQQRSIAQNAINTQCQVNAQVPAQLLRWMLSNENALLDMAINSKKGGSLKDRDLKWLYNLNAHATVVSHLNLSSAVLETLVNKKVYWDYTARDKEPVSLDLKNFHRLCAFAELRDSVENGEALALQWLQSVNSPGENPPQHLQELFGLNPSDATYAIQTPPKDVGQMAALKRRQKVCKKIGLSLSALQQVVGNKTRSANFTTRQQIADTLLNAVRATAQENNL